MSKKRLSKESNATVPIKEYRIYSSIHTQATIALMQQVMMLTM